MLHILWNGHIGGAERAVFQLARHQHQEGHRRVAIGFGQADGPYAQIAREAGVRVIDFGLSSGRDMRALRRAHKLLAQFDIHHFHVAEPVLMLASISNRGAKRVYTHRGGVTEYHGRRRWRYTAARYLLPRLDAVTGTRQAAAAANQTFGISVNDIFTTFNGLDFGLLQSSGARERLRAQHQISPETVIVGTAASLRAWKRIDWLVQAAGELSSDDFAIWIIGDGPDRRRLEQLAARSPAADRFRFLGSQLQVADWLRCLDVFVSPSGPAESFGNAVVEAMGCGLATVVSADCPAHLQHVEDARTGIVVGDATELAARLRELIADCELRARLGGAAMSFVRHRYTMARSAESFEVVYRALDAGGARGRAC